MTFGSVLLFTPTLMFAMASAYADGGATVQPTGTEFEAASGLDTIASNLQGTHVCEKPAVGRLVKQRGWYFTAQGELVIQKPPTSDAMETHENYDLVINLKFDVPDYKGPEKSQKQQEFRDYTANCYKELSKFLIGPEGEKITLRFPENDEEDRATPDAKIKVAKSCGGVRANSDCWFATTNCPVIWHETLHRLGLFDEYTETSFGGALHEGGNLTRAGWNCRAIGETTSIMNQTTLAFQALYPTYKVSVYQCPANASDEANRACASALDQVANGKPLVSPVIVHQNVQGPSMPLEKPIDFSDPQVASYIQTNILQPNLNNLKYFGIDELTSLDPQDWADYAASRLIGKRVSPLRYEKVEVIPPTKKAALSPAEFTAILFPTCSINDLFYTCGKFVTENGNCNGRPKECDQSDVWTGLPAGQIP